MIQDGRNDELERELESLKRLFEQEMAGAEAEMDAEENEHLQKITKTLSDEHTQGLKAKQRDIMKSIADQCPEAEQVAMQRLMDQHRRDVESLDQELALERDRQISDIQVCLFVNISEALSAHRLSYLTAINSKLIACWDIFHLIVACWFF